MGPATISASAPREDPSGAGSSRGALYPLAPLGSGTALAESLTGYLARLADLYAVDVWTLYRHVVAPRLTAPWLARPERRVSLHAHSHKANGVGIVAADFVQALEAATHRGDLQGLTMRPWSPILSPVRLLRLRSAWCAACYADWRARGQPCHSPLLWALGDVRVCPTHRRALQERCPGCRRVLAPLTAAPRTEGMCPYCGHDLAADDAAGPIAPPGDRGTWPLWVAQALGYLVSAPPATGAPTRGQIAAMVELCVPALAPSFNALARAARMAPQSLSLWRHGRQQITLGQLCRFCYTIGMWPHLFLAHDTRTPLPGSLAPADLLATLPPAVSPRKRIEQAAARRALEAALTAVPPVPLSQVAREINYPPCIIRTLFPDLNRAICERYARFAATRRQVREEAQIAEIYRAVTDLVARDTYPSHGRVDALLPFGLRHPTLVAAWRAAVEEVAWDPVAEGHPTRGNEPAEGGCGNGHPAGPGGPGCAL